MTSGEEAQKPQEAAKKSKRGSVVKSKKGSVVKSKKKSGVEQRKKSTVGGKKKKSGKSKKEAKPKKGLSMEEKSDEKATLETKEEPTVEARSKESNDGVKKAPETKKGSTVETRTRESNDGGAEKRKKGSARTKTSTKTTVTTSGVKEPVILEAPPKNNGSADTLKGTAETVGNTPAGSASKANTVAASPGTPGYGRKTNRSNDYTAKGSASSDEKKKFEKYKEDRLRRQAQLKDDKFSPECLLGFTIFSVMTVIALIGTTFGMFQKPATNELINFSPTYAHENSRRVMVIMSENLDCSLYMKRQTMQMVDLREVALAGLQCLYINEPHSVAPDAGISILTYYSQEKRAALNNRNHGFLKEGLSCKLRAKTHYGCDLRSYLYYYSSLVTLSGNNFGEKSVNSVWMRNGAKAYKQRYKHVFRKLFRFLDSGTPTYKEVLTTDEYESSATFKVIETRVFQVSKLFDRMIKATAKRKPQTFSDEYTAMFNITTSSKRNDRITVTKSLARNVVHNFLYTEKKPAKAPGRLRKVRLHLPNTLLKFADGVPKIPYVLFPKGSTHSIFAAFVFATVYDATMRKMRQEQGKEWNPKEHELYTWSARAQKLAMHYFVNSREWTGNPDDISMFKRVILASKQVTKELPEGLLMPTKKHVDRSASIVLWQRNDTDEVHIINTALPKLFGSRHINGRTRLKFDRFEVEIGGKTVKSLPFMSSTSLIVMEQAGNDPISANPQYVVTSSGSIRNIEAVAMTAILATLLDYSPGRVTWSPSFYLDIRDGKFYCDMGYGKSPSYPKHAKAIYEKVQEEPDLSCEPLKRTELMARDRIVMFAARPNNVTGKYYKAINSNKYMWASVDPRADDYNYAAGY